MNKTALAKKIRQLTANPVPDDFIFDLLLAYKLPKSSVTILKNGPRNMLAAGGGVTMKRKLFFLPLRPEDDPLTVRDEIRDSLTENQRFIVLTDYVRFYGYDTKLDEALDCDFTDLADHYDFFLPWAGIEKTRHYDENPADVKAAERMAKLFDVIKRENPDDSPAFVHDLNVFLSRVLFCFFAEDTGIFPGQNLFSNGIGSQTALDGHDLQGYLTELFTVLDLDSGHRTGVRAHFLEFPYVNGGLFRDRIQVPTFSARSRRALIDAGTLNWSDINPDIFGSMIQAVVTAEHRGGLGMHYTSVPNIMKVIEPLFLNDLRETFTKAHDGRYEKNDLKELRERIGKLKIFDPACGSGNFLIIAYKELRKLEMEIIQRQADLGADAGARGSLFERGAGAVSTVSLNQFYGIEIDDFAHEIAILALWLAEHQMNADFERVFGQSKPTLPLADAGHIFHGNACRVDWEEVCPKVEGDETYILGNPPYLGARVQDKHHKADMAFVFEGFKKYKDLDLIAAWFYKGAKYIKEANSRMAFVSTNSICQGEQVTLIWPPIFKLNIEIEFAHQSFKWTNSAKGNAGVVVIIVGLVNSDQSRQKKLYGLDKSEDVDFINAYLVVGSDTIIRNRTQPLSDFPAMSFGNMPNDGGGLILSEKEKCDFLEEWPDMKWSVKQLVGAAEFIRGQERYCIWLPKESLKDASKNSFVRNRIEIVKSHRLESKDSGTNQLAERPHQFRDLNEPDNRSIIIPIVSSIRREYIPCGVLDKQSVITNLAQAIYDPPIYLISVVMSGCHMVWVRSVAGRLKTDYRYSKGLCYNTFPFPPITPAQEARLTETALGILSAREQHPGSTLAQLYDPDKMPENLREAHRANDLAVEACYRSEPFTSDEERLAYLFGLYEEMIAAEKEEDTLFAATKKKGKRRKKG
jgi:hypothetical protein